jgi:hypothetical protein
MVQVVHQYARLTELKAEVKRLEAVARPAALKFAAQGLAVLEGPDGVVTIKPKKGANRFNMEKAREVLGNMLDHFYETGEPTNDVVFTPRTRPTA